MYVGYHVNYLLVLPDFNETLLFNRFSKNARMSNFMKIRSVGPVLFYADTDRRTDGNEDANSHFLQICESA